MNRAVNVYDGVRLEEHNGKPLIGSRAWRSFILGTSYQSSYAGGPGLRKDIVSKHRPLQWSWRVCRGESQRRTRERPRPCSLCPPALLSEYHGPGDPQTGILSSSEPGFSIPWRVPSNSHGWTHTRVCLQGGLRICFSDELSGDLEFWKTADLTLWELRQRLPS